MTNKIEFIEVNGNELPLNFFPEHVKQQVATYEIARQQYNESAVNTQALNVYMQQLGASIQQMATEHVNAQLAPKSTEAVPSAADILANFQATGAVPGEVGEEVVEGETVAAE